MSLKILKPRLATPDRSVAKLPPKTAADFYGSREWKQVRAEVVAARGRRCELCGRGDTRPFVDHIQELKDGGAALDKANLRVTCGSCHSAKTAAARDQRRGGG